MKFAALYMLAAPLLLVPVSAAVRADSQPGSSGSPAGVLPLHEVVLFSSGVGYFGREGKVDGDAQVDLTIRAPQLADILKSLVILDPGGTAQPVAYSIDDWLARRPQQTDLKMDAAATPGALLRGFQGAAVRLEKEKGAVEGRVVSVSNREVKMDDSLITIEAVTLATEKGLETVRLDDVTSFRLTDPALDAKLRASLEKLASGMTAKLDDGARTVSLRFVGKGSRAVRAGYLLETPVWKTSYRLVLDAGAKPYLQGWAIVENTSDEDWQGVHMTLVSGQPVSFVQDLAAPVYVSRPVLAPPVQGSAMPQTYGEGYGGVGATLGRQRMVIGQGLIYDNDLTPTDGALFNRAIPHAESAAGFDRNDLARIKASAARGYANNLADAVNRANFGNGEAQASGEARGELFAYALDRPLDLPRGRASMVPIVGQDVAGDAVTIVVSNGQSVGELAPANGFALKNVTGAHLQGGPVTVFDGGIYAGDALIGNVAPNESRLLSYAADLELMARLDKVETGSTLLTLTAANGNLIGQYGYVRERVWLLRNKGRRAKTVILQIPDESGFQLSDPKQLDEKAADGLRFRVPLRPGQSSAYTVRTQTTGRQNFVLADLSMDRITGLMRETAATAEMKAALQEVLNRRATLTGLAAQRVAQEAALKEIEADQGRIRDNMARLTTDSDLYKKYVAKLTAQEERVDAAREEIGRLRAVETETQVTLAAYISGLNVK